MEKIIVVDKSEVLQGAKGDYLQVTDKKGKKQNIFDQSLWGLFQDGLAVKLTLEKQGNWNNVTGAVGVAQELAEKTPQEGEEPNQKAPGRSYGKSKEELIQQRQLAEAQNRSIQAQTALNRAVDLTVAYKEDINRGDARQLAEANEQASTPETALVDEKPHKCLLDWSSYLKKWVAPKDWIKNGKDGCTRKACGFETCHNYGKDFGEPDRLVISEPKADESRLPHIVTDKIFSKEDLETECQRRVAGIKKILEDEGLMHHMARTNKPTLNRVLAALKKQVSWSRVGGNRPNKGR